MSFSTDLKSLMPKDTFAQEPGENIMHDADRQSHTRDTLQVMEDMQRAREDVNTLKVVAPPSVISQPVGLAQAPKESFLNYFPFLSAFNISDSDIKNMVIGLVLLMVLQMPQFKSSLLGVVPQILKSNTHVANLTSAAAVVLLYVVIQKLMT